MSKALGHAHGTSFAADLDHRELGIHHRQVVVRENGAALRVEGPFVADLTS
jgi:hypothetical protein